MLQKCVCGILK